MADLYPVADPPVFIQWQPPTFAALNATFQNPANQDALCAKAGLWYAGWVNSIQDDQNADETAVDYGLAVSAAATVDYMYTLLYMTNSSSLPNSNRDNFTAGETMLAWYTESPSFPYFLVDIIPATACNDAICQALDWQGDQDVSGVGMIISYYMVSIMVTLYFFFNVASIFRDHRSDKRTNYQPRNALFHTIMVAFRSSVHIFQDAALIFSISMSIAGITRYVTTLNNPTKHYQIYGLIGSAFMSTFTIFPAVILQTVIEVKRHFWLRLFLWFLLIPAAVTLDVLYEVLYKNRNWDTTNVVIGEDVPRKQAVEVVWLDFCDFPDQRNRLRTVLTVGHILLAGNVLWWLYHLLRGALPKLNSPRIKRWWVPIQKFGVRYKVERRFLLLNALACLTFMWLFLGLFHRYRNAVKSKAGDSNTDTTWTFGQVMAVTTWIPVFIDWLTAAIYESKHESDAEAHAKKHPREKGGYQPAHGGTAPDPEVDSLYMVDPNTQKQPFHEQTTQYPPQTAHGQQYHQAGQHYQMQQFNGVQQGVQQYHGQQAPEIYYDPS